MEFGSAEGEGLRRFTVRCIQDANALLETGRRQDRGARGEEGSRKIRLQTIRAELNACAFANIRSVIVRLLRGWTDCAHISWLIEGCDRGGQNLSTSQSCLYWTAGEEPNRAARAEYMRRQDRLREVKADSTDNQ